MTSFVTQRILRCIRLSQAVHFSFLFLLIVMGTRNALAGPDNNGALKYVIHCARCHGTEGHGDGPAAQGLATQPCNFRDCGEMRRVPDATLFRIIKSGGAAAGLSNEMPAWSGTLKDGDIHELIRYLRCFCIEDGATSNP